VDQPASLTFESSLVAVLLVPVRRMISLVPKPSAVSNTIHACYCGLSRSLTIASSRARSAALTATLIPSRILARPSPERTYTCGDYSYVRLYPLVISVE
jgi:hypothetical protein